MPMTHGVLTRGIRVIGIAALWSASALTGVSADPITVTSGLFVSPEDSPPGFRFLGTDGFVLVGHNPRVSASPRDPCVSGCLPGTMVNMSTVAGGLAPFSLGISVEANIMGTEYFRSEPFGGWLAGTLRFDAPVVTLPPLESPTPLTVPFVFSGHVTGFSRNTVDDVDPGVALFDVSLVGQGTAMLEFLDRRGGSYFEPYVTYTFSDTLEPVPEPGTLLLLATGLVAGVRRWAQSREH